MPIFEVNEKSLLFLQHRAISITKKAIISRFCFRSFIRREHREEYKIEKEQALPLHAIEVC